MRGKEGDFSTRLPPADRSEPLKERKGLRDSFVSFSLPFCLCRTGMSEQNI